MTEAFEYDVSIIGAGPSGSVAAALLCQMGYSVCVVERQIFPRFSIGESLLPQSMSFMEQAGLLDDIKALNFQRKDGADFNYQGQLAKFDFHKKSSEGPAETYQVVRAVFDHGLIDGAIKKGAKVFYDTSVDAVAFTKDSAVLSVSGPEGKRDITSRFCMDASGYGRVLPRLLDLDLPSKFPKRTAFFTHVKDHIATSAPDFNRDHILITVHPEFKDVWYWLIPFSNGVASIGVVGAAEHFAPMIEAGKEPKEILQHYISDDGELRRILGKAEYNIPVQNILGYSCSVKSLYGDSFALLGNAGEFLDPIFSSGVTIAMKSAVLATAAFDRQFKGETVDWQTEYSEPLMVGVNTFRAFVESWYRGELIDIFFAEGQSNPAIKEYLTSILAGYAWDESNPYVAQPSRRLKSLYEVCK